MIKLIVGLGNPGLQYKKTRHNAGFLFLDYLAKSCGVNAWGLNRQFNAEVALIDWCGERIVLLKPQTFMNASGFSVQKAVNFYKLVPEEVLVVHDELELAEGEARLKVGGGHGGHNGIRDISAKLGLTDFYRIRVGIARPTHGSVSDYVLSRPDENGEKIMTFLFEKIRLNLDQIINKKLKELIIRN